MPQEPSILAHISAALFGPLMAQPGGQQAPSTITCPLPQRKTNNSKLFTQRVNNFSNWPEALRATANWPASAYSMPAYAVPRSLKKKTEPKFNDDIPTEDQQKIDESMSKWLDRQSKMV